ncbi:MAG: DUF1559 domain-containing protein, partial [Planctomycetia bacterium]|nr:DUF1559 domain-containing protein [Planctomycetia bacterium]
GFHEAQRSGHPHGFERIVRDDARRSGNHRVQGVTSGWSYAGWVSVGIDPVGAWNVTFPAQGLNIWNYNNNPSALNKVRGRRASWYNAASLHTGGVNFVFADGSVRFIPESISVPTLTLLSRMGDGQVITNMP